MNPYLRDRINRKLDTLPDDRLYQVLDFIDFLQERYAEKPAAEGSLFQRFAEGVEDRLRAGGVAASTVAETMGLLGKAMGVLSGVAQTTVNVATNVATEVASRARSAVDSVGAPPTPVDPGASSGSTESQRPFGAAQPDLGASEPPSGQAQPHPGLGATEPPRTPPSNFDPSL